MRLYYQVYADEFPASVTFTEIFNVLSELGKFEKVTVTQKQIRLLLMKSKMLKIDDPVDVSEDNTEIKIGINYSSFRPSFIQVSATTPEKAAEVFRRLLIDAYVDEAEKAINVFGSKEEVVG
jgi:hypothetical protein